MVVVLTVEGDRAGSEERHFNRALMMWRPGGLVFYVIGLCLSERGQDELSRHRVRG